MRYRKPTAEERALWKAYIKLERKDEDLWARQPLLARGRGEAYPWNRGERVDRARAIVHARKVALMAEIDALMARIEGGAL